MIKRTYIEQVRDGLERYVRDNSRGSTKRLMQAAGVTRGTVLRFRNGKAARPETVEAWAAFLDPLGYLEPSQPVSEAPAPIRDIQEKLKMLAASLDVEVPDSMRLEFVRQGLELLLRDELVAAREFIEDRDR